MSTAIPLSLYVHFPWCVRKCPYCDFNSHALRTDLPERAYVDALLIDLQRELDRTTPRQVETVFFGGGTPSLISAAQVARVIERLRDAGRLAADAEITLEANPGTAEAQRFTDYRAIGINRLSIGVQSFDDDCLRAIGRIHDGDEAHHAVELAHAAGFERINVDLMYGLPGQGTAQALRDVRSALSLEPGHISHYQLTLEPETAFYKRPPQLPGQEQTWDMLAACASAFAGHGYRRYEVSALARPGRRARHNLNYWLFGDYIGIGAGAHGKLTTAGSVVRSSRPRPPSHYLDAVHAGEWDRRAVASAEVAFEFMLNALRLTSGFPRSLFEQRTGMPLGAIDTSLQQAVERKLLKTIDDWIQPTTLGMAFLNDLQLIFLPDKPVQAPGWPIYAQ